MRQLVTTAIVLRRTDYGEADRILSLLTPDHGKLSVMAKGVRRVKSKLAGGIELFSVSDITYIPGKGNIDTLVSARLLKHYSQIVQDLDRTMTGYDLIKQLNKITEDAPGPEYFHLLEQAFEALDSSEIALPLVRFWFSVRLLLLTGHSPNLTTDVTGAKLSADVAYDFDLEHMCFRQISGAGEGGFGTDDIKFLRLGFGGHHVRVLSQVQGSVQLVTHLLPLVISMLQSNLRV